MESVHAAISVLLLKTSCFLSADDGKLGSAGSVHLKVTCLLIGSDWLQINAL